MKVVEIVQCEDCRGKKSIDVRELLGQEATPEWMVCPECDGKGWVTTGEPFDLGT